MVPSVQCRLALRGPTGLFEEARVPIPGRDADLRDGGLRLAVRVGDLALSTCGLILLAAFVPADGFAIQVVMSM
jgi:hypothetical protein